MAHNLFGDKTLYYLTLLAVSASILTSCTNSSKISDDGRTYNITNVEGSKNLFIQTEDFSGVIFSANTKAYQIKSRRFTPTIEEILKAENIFKRYLVLGRKDSDGVIVDKMSINSPESYYRQYIGFYNKQNQKVIYFNCFTKPSKKVDNNWQKEELAVKDGGNNYFSLLINIKIENCSLFMVHGRA